MVSQFFKRNIKRCLSTLHSHELGVIIIIAVTRTHKLLSFFINGGQCDGNVVDAKMQICHDVRQLMRLKCGVPEVLFMTKIS